MANCGIPRIDNLIANTSGARPLVMDDPDLEAVSVLRDLLICAGEKLKRIRQEEQPKFDARMAAALRRFHRRERLPFDEKAPAAGPLTFQRLIVAKTFCERVMGRASVTLLLDIAPFTTQLKILTLTSAWESDCSFSKLNLNQDGAGLSFGIIQWAQSAGRLWEPLKAFKQENSRLFSQIFGVDAQFNFLKDLGGGVWTRRGLAEILPSPPWTKKDRQMWEGVPKGSTPDLTMPPWSARFVRAGHATAFQRVQVWLSLKAYQKAFTALVPNMPKITTERGVAFLLDYANQYGIRTVLRFYQLAVNDLGASAKEEDIRKNMAERPKEPGRSRDLKRREFFLHTPLLSDDRYWEG